MAIKRRTAKSASNKKPAERVGLGGGSVDRHLKQKRKKKSNVYYSVGDGNTAVVRAVDTKKLFKDGFVHQVPFEGRNGEYTVDIRCLDPEDEGEPCPGCRDDLDRRYKFWMVVIVRDAPKENSSGKVISEEDQVRILSAGSRLAKALNAKHRRRDLAKRDIEISQSGTGFDVEYEVEWATDDDEPLTEEDKALVSEAKNVMEAFDKYTEIRDEDSFYDSPSSNSSDDDDDEDIGERTKRRGQAFAERKNKAKFKKRSVEPDNDDDDDEAEEDAPPSPRRRGTGKVRSAKVKSSSKSTTTRKRRNR